MTGRPSVVSVALRHRGRLARTGAAGALVLLMVVAAGCDGTTGSKRERAEPPPPSVGFLRRLGAAEGRLVLAAPPGYVEDGSTDPKVDWVTPFERATRCKVSVEEADGTDALIRALRRGDVDGVAGPSDVVLRVAATRDAAPINTTLVPRLASALRGLERPPFALFRGRTYAVAFGRVADAIIWRTDQVAAAPTSWRALFDRSSPYRGRISLPDDAMMIADAALYLRAHRPRLRIRDPYELDRRQLQAAVELLKRQRSLVKRYWTDETKAELDFARRDAVLGVAPQSVARKLVADEVPLRSRVPTEGSTGRARVWMLSSRARHPSCMYRWLDHVLSPAANADAAKWLGHAPVTAAACRVRSARRHCFLYHALDQTYFSRVHLARTPQRTCGDRRGRVCADYARWLAAWDEARG